MLRKLRRRSHVSDVCEYLCLVAIRVAGTCGDSLHPSIGLQQGCPLIATLFGLLIDGLHQYLQDAVPDAGVRVQHLRVTDLI